MIRLSDVLPATQLGREPRPSTQLLEDFTPGTVAGPVLIPAGTRDIEIFAADSAYEAGAGAIRVSALVVTAGLNASIAASTFGKLLRGTTPSCT